MFDFFLQTCLFQTKRVALSVDDTGPVFECKRCAIHFSKHDHVACTECAQKNKRHLQDIDVWTERLNNKQYLELIQTHLGRSTSTDGHICVCVSCQEILDNSIFHRRKSGTFRGWATLLDWKDTQIALVTRDMSILDKRMWSDEERRKAQYVLCDQGQAGEGKGGGVFESSPKKKRKQKPLDSDNKDADKISDDIIRTVLNLRLGEQDTESSENESEITKEIEVCLGKSEGELLQYSSEIVSIHRSCVSVKKKTREHLEKFPHDQDFSLNGFLEELYKEPDLDHEIRQHLSVWKESIRVWVIQCNEELDAVSGICVNKIMEGYSRLKKGGISGAWVKCRVVQKLQARRHELVSPWEVHWDNGDTRDNRKYRWQLRVSNEVVNGDDEGESGGADEGVTGASSAVTNDDDAPLLTLPKEGGSGETLQGGISTRHQGEGGSEVSLPGTTTHLSNFVLVRETAFSTARSKIADKTKEVKESKPIFWDVHEVTKGVVQETLSCLQEKWKDDADKLAVVTDLKFELREISEEWVSKSLKDLLFMLVKSIVKSGKMMEEPEISETPEMHLAKLQKLVRNKLGESISSQVLTRYDYVIEDVVSKQWKIHGIFRDGAQGCSQSEEQINQDDSATRILPRGRMTNTCQNRFQQDIDLLYRVLGTPAEYLLYFTREQVWAMGCCNHTSLHKYLIEQQESLRTQLSVEAGGDQPWTCSQCQVPYVLCIYKLYRPSVYISNVGHEETESFSRTRFNTLPTCRYARKIGTFRVPCIWRNQSQGGFPVH